MPPVTTAVEDSKHIAGMSAIRYRVPSGTGFKPLLPLRSVKAATTWAEII